MEYATSAEQLLLATVRLTPEYSSENLLQVWDAATGQLLFERAGEPMIAFSALGGNTSLVIARTGYGSWEVYDLETRATVSFENRGQPGPSPNGELVETHVLGSGGGSVIRATGDITLVMSHLEKQSPLFLEIRFQLVILRGHPVAISL